MENVIEALLPIVAALSIFCVACILTSPLDDYRVLRDRSAVV